MLNISQLDTREEKPERLLTAFTDGGNESNPTGTTDRERGESTGAPACFFLTKSMSNQGQRVSDALMSVSLPVKSSQLKTDASLGLKNDYNGVIYGVEFANSS